MAKRVLRAYIDESGGRSRSLNASDHFVMGAATFFEDMSPNADMILDRVRTATKRLPGHHLHWNKFTPAHRMDTAQILGEPDCHISPIAVVVCKRHLPVTGTMTEDQAYLLTFRYLLERLSWLARQNKA